MSSRVQFLIIFLFSYFGRISRSDSPVIEQRILGGKVADIREVPYQLSLEHGYPDGFVHVCGAAAIAEFWAVTTAHCTYQFQIPNLRIRAGTNYRQLAGQLYQIAGVTIHPGYNPSIDDFDIAVIRVARPFIFSAVLQPVALAQTTPPPGTRVIVSGWGSTKIGRPDAERLHKVIIKVVDHQRCNAVYQRFGGITPRMLCAGSSNKKDACGGDSGGPLATEGKVLVGVVSRGMECNDNRFPGIYTDVAYVHGWIMSVIH